MKKKITLLFTLLCAWSLSFSQNIPLPDASKKATVSEWIGLTEVTISYHRPGVKGREGKIYGEGNLLPYDGGKPMPWRAGANENTTIYFQDDVTIEGQALKAGKYGFHIIPAESEWTLIFSNNSHSWGSYFYDEKEDAMRVSVKPQSCEMTDWLCYDFINQTDNSVDVRLRWERKQITFKVATDLHAVTMANLRAYLQAMDGFNGQSLDAAALYCVQQNKDLDQGLAWANRAADPAQFGQENFATLSTKSVVLAKMGKDAEAKALMDKALPLATMVEAHQYARQLLSDGKKEEAFKIFKMNREKYPNDNFTTIVGLARGYMAVGKFKEAAQYFKQAAPNAPVGQSQAYLDLAKECEGKLKQGG